MIDLELVERMMDVVRGVRGMIVTELDDLIQSPPPRRHSEKIDTWLRDSLHQWEICWDNRKSAGIAKAIFHKLEYSIIEVVSTINSEWIKKSKSTYNEFGRRGHAYKVKITPIPNDPDSSSEEYSEIEDEDESSEKAEEQAKDDEDHTEGGDAEVVGSSFLLSAVPMAETSQPCSVTSFERTKVVPFVDLRSKGSSLPKPTKEVPRPRPQMITRRRSVPPLAPSDTSSEVEGSRVDHLLAKRSPDKPKKVVPLHTDNAALPAEVLKESNPPQLEEQETTSPMVVERSVVTLPSVTPAVGFVWPDVSDLIDFQEEVLPAFPVAEPMNVDDDDRPLSPPEDEAFMSLEPTFNPPAHIEAPSPPPCKYKPACRQKFADSLDEIDYSTLPAIVARPSRLEKSLEDVRRSHRARRSPPAKNAPVNPKPASQNPLKRRLQKLAQSSAQQQLQEGSLDEADTSRPRKRRSALAVGDIDEEPAAKRAKTVSSTADNVLPTLAVCKCGPSPTKPPLVALGMGGGGFGEMPNESFKALANGIAHIGVLEVEEDYGRFVKVDGRLWNKEVAVFVGEWYSKPCDQCKSRGTHCRKFLTHTSICVHCHYSKAPCTVNGDNVLNPIDHLPSKSHYLQEVSSFGPTLKVVAQKAESMISKIRQFLAGLDILEDAQVVQDQVASLRQSVRGSSAPEKNIEVDGAIAAGSFEEEPGSSKD
ncbi:hypothetical protein IW261DRAFT_1671260 [Armillaria novae-zelandiae]|uniref:Uncharacterized protein n=1 Tax=Armillaria novae-zelandiae TaxID=153914 RepID=A0AA39NSM1_9AGAR|nr:hypothetical protein IW261DRAFT_1671260 [Armillaria novae-zelandiae]